MKPKTMNKLQNNLIVLIALASAALALFAYYSFSNMAPPKEKCEEIFLEWYKTYPNTYYDTTNERLYPAHASDKPFPAEKRLHIGRAIKNYEIRDFMLVGHAINVVLTDEEVKEYPGLCFYYALAELQLTETDKAIHFLSYLSELDDFYYKDEVKWYLAMAYIRSCNFSKARNTLKRLSKEAISSSYQEMATSLLAEL